MKPRIFIGSSSEGLKVSEFIKEQLSDVAECVIWNDNVFSFNKSYFETLLNIINFYDYGILVATGDDFTTSRDKAFDAPRDNVIFEFGLFLGRLGRNRVFILLEEGSKLPSDLLGISLPTFPKKAGAGRNHAIIQICVQLKQQMERSSDVFELGLLPSVSLAYGYFSNFIKRTCERLLEDENIVVDGNKIPFKDFRFCVLIPDDLSDDMYDKVKAIRKERDWKPIKVDAGGMRPFEFHDDLSTQSEGVIELYDIPLTLNSLHQSIQQYLAKPHLGKDFYETMLERREITAFQKVLDNLVASNAITKKRVKTEIVPV
ncbi:MAG: nucleotide-binding protein [Saprospirales bacterium]|nr:nucleotide-binding protein [Saprospirales bacterium]